MRFKPVLVEWRDITSHPFAQDFEEAVSKKTTDCKTLGFLLKTTRDDLFVAGDIFEDGVIRDINVIPRGVVQKITYFKQKEKK
jgi:hypothetical protein